jgi:hypothetical protein
MPRREITTGHFLLCWQRPILPGSFPPSIFGTGELNFRVRDGNGWDLTVMNTSSASFASGACFLSFPSFSLPKGWTAASGWPGANETSNKKEPLLRLFFGAGEDLFYQAASRQVSSALVSLTSVFGMGTGGTSP